MTMLDIDSLRTVALLGLALIGCSCPPTRRMGSVARATSAATCGSTHSRPSGIAARTPGRSTSVDSSPTATNQPGWRRGWGRRHHGCDASRAVGRDVRAHVPHWAATALFVGHASLWWVEPLALEVRGELSRRGCQRRGHSRNHPIAGGQLELGFRFPRCSACTWCSVVRSRPTLRMRSRSSTRGSG
jgi:hypothetical protein